MTKKYQSERNRLLRTVKNMRARHKRDSAEAWETILSLRKRNQVLEDHIKTLSKVEELSRLVGKRQNIDALNIGELFLLVNKIHEKICQSK